MSTFCEIVLRWIPQNVFHDSIGSSGNGVVRQQPVTWANVDPGPYHHVLSLGHSELKLIRFVLMKNRSCVVMY